MGLSRRPLLPSYPPRRWYHRFPDFAGKRLGLEEAPLASAWVPQLVRAGRSGSQSLAELGFAASFSLETGDAGGLQVAVRLRPWCWDRKSCWSTWPGGACWSRWPDSRGGAGLGSLRPALTQCWRPSLRLGACPSCPPGSSGHAGLSPLSLCPTRPFLPRSQSDPSRGVLVDVSQLPPWKEQEHSFL